VFNDDAMSTFFTDQNVGGNDGLMDLIINTAPHIPLTSYKDFNNSKFAQFNNYYNFYGYNPYWAVDNWRSEGKNESLLTSVDVNIKATDWLNFTYRAGGSFNFNTTQNFSRGEVPSAYMLSTGSANRPVPDNVGEASFRSSRISSDFFASFNKKFLDNDLGVSAIAGTFVRQAEVKDMQSSIGNMVVPELYNISNKAGEVNGTATRSKSRIFSLYGSVSLNYKGWVNLEVTGRSDQVSVLAPGNNKYFYPGVNAAFIPTDAFKGLKGDLLSYIKVRASWNKTGNADIAPYRLGSTFSQTSGFPYGTLPGYTADDVAYDPLLKPEFIESREVGIDLGFLKNRINFEATYFNQDNTNQIVNINVSGATGYTSAFVNAASFNNNGFEFDLRLTPLINLGDVTIDFKANATYNDSKITTIYPGLDEISIGGFATLAGNYGIVGKPAFVWKATDYLRDDQGRVIVDGVSGYPSKAANLGVFGRTMPLWLVGLNPSVAWKGLNLSVLFDYKGGHYVYNDIGSDMAWTGTSAATARNHRERFVVPNSSIVNSGGKYDPNTNVTVTDVNDFYTGLNTFRGIATNFLTSASAWRLREASLAYNFPLKVIGDPKFIKGITIVLTGRNLLLFLPETNEFSDPDFNFTSEGNTNGVVDVQVNPPVRTYGFGINVRL
jgi:outer membrane receptor protein involved in Fe transport